MSKTVTLLIRKYCLQRPFVKVTWMMLKVNVLALTPNPDVQISTMTHVKHAPSLLIPLSFDEALCTSLRDTHTHTHPVCFPSILRIRSLTITCQMKFLFRKKTHSAVGSSACQATPAALVLKPIIQHQSFRCTEGRDWQDSIWGPRLTWHLGFIRSGTKGRGKIIRVGCRQINLFIPPHLPPPSPLLVHIKTQPLKGNEGGRNITFSQP